MLQFSSFAALCPKQICKGLVDNREGAGLRDTRRGGGVGQVKIYPCEKGTRGFVEWLAEVVAMLMWGGGSKNNFMVVLMQILVILKGRHKVGRKNIQICTMTIL